MKPNIFLSFDVENDEDLRRVFFDEANQPAFPLKLKAWSEADADENIVRDKIRHCDSVLVLCGEMTFQQGNVDREFKIAQEEGKPFVLLQGRRGRLCSPPPSAAQTDNLHAWSRETLERFAAGDL